MRRYDPTEALIFIHVPKTAGQSVFAVVRDWFGGRVCRHYYDEANRQLPVWHDLRARDAPRMVFGHFNRNRGFGIEDYYPEAMQFVTLLRDPLAMHISRYFYTRRKAPGWHETGRGEMPEDLGTFIETGHLNMLEHFPRAMTAANWRYEIETRFVDIGCVETLEASLARIARRLGQKVPDGALPRKNAGPDQRLDIPEETRRRFRERWPLEHAVYDYARSRGCGGAG